MSVAPRPLLTRASVRAIDQDAIERLGVPGLVLMENAGRGAVDALNARFGPSPGRVLVVAGPGQNGGDGWVVARHLLNQGVTVDCVLVGARERVRGDASVNLAALEAMGQSVCVLESIAGLAPRLAQTSIVVDALFGTGLDRPVSGLFAEVIEAIAASGLPVVALDLPSGVDADTGAVLGVAAPAVLTVTFAALKRGLFQYPAAALVGELSCASIGVPSPREANAFVIEPRCLRALDPRPRDSHKARAGHVLVLAGSPGTTGAALLCAQGAFRSGAGLVTLAPRPEAFEALGGRVLEAMTHALPVQGLVDAALEAAKDKAAAALGCGWGRDAAGLETARALARELQVPAVIDADALTAHAGDPGALREARAARVLTPHPGEAARLLGISNADVQADRYAAARQLCERSGQVVVLKGAGSIVAAPDGRLAVCDRGTPALGVAGTGDVLAGVIAAQLAVAEPFEAAQAGVWLHARAGELAAVADRGLVASDVAEAIPRTLAELQAAP